MKMLLRAISPSLRAAWRPATSSQLVCTIVIIIINNITINKIIIANRNSVIAAVIIVSFIIIITSLSTSDQLVWSLFHVNQLLTPFVSIFQFLLLGCCLLYLSGASRCSGQNFDLADLIFVIVR